MRTTIPRYSFSILLWVPYRDKAFQNVCGANVPFCSGYLLFTFANNTLPLDSSSNPCNPNRATISTLQIYDTIGELHGVPNNIATVLRRK